MEESWWMESVKKMSIKIVLSFLPQILNFAQRVNKNITSIKTFNVSFFLLFAKKSPQMKNVSDAWINSYLLLILPFVLTQIVFRPIDLMVSVINAKAISLKISREFVLL